MRRETGRPVALRQLKMASPADDVDAASTGFDGGQHLKEKRPIRVRVNSISLSIESNCVFTNCALAFGVPLGFASIA